MNQREHRRGPCSAPRFVTVSRSIAGLRTVALPALVAAVAPATSSCVDAAHAQSVDERYNGGELDRRCPRRVPRVHANCPIASARAQVSCSYGTSRPSTICNCVATRDGPRWNCRALPRPPVGPLPPPDLDA